MGGTDAADVEAAAIALIEAFAANDRPRYFACFTPDASFVFPIVDRVLASRADYEAAWQGWIDSSGFRVLACQSHDRAVQLQGNTAVFIHRTVTDSTSSDGDITLHERETIIFHRIGGVWMATHEHVSPLTGTPPSD